MAFRAMACGGNEIVVLLPMNKTVLLILTLFFINCASHIAGTHSTWMRVFSDSHVIIYPEHDNYMNGLNTNFHFGDSIRTICVAPVTVDPIDTTSIFLPGSGNTGYRKQFSYCITDPSVVETDIHHTIESKISEQGFWALPCKIVDTTNLKSSLDERIIDTGGLTKPDLSQFKRTYNIDCILFFTLHYARYFSAFKYNFHDMRMLNGSLCSPAWHCSLIPEVKMSIKVISTRTSEILWNYTSYTRGTYGLAKPILNKDCPGDPKEMMELLVRRCLWPFYSQEQQIYLSLYASEKRAKTRKDSIDIIENYIAAYPKCTLLFGNLAWKNFLNKDTADFIKHARYAFSRDASHDRAGIVNYAHTFVFRNLLDSAIYYYQDAISRFGPKGVSAIKGDFTEFNNIYPAWNEAISYIRSKLFPVLPPSK
jgi:hypothetical protein